MYSLPDLIIDEVPLRLRGDGRIEFCKRDEAIFFGDFLLKIAAASREEWQIEGVAMAMVKRFPREEVERVVPLPADLVCEAIAIFEDHDDDLIRDHIDAKLPEPADLEEEYA